MNRAKEKLKRLGWKGRTWVNTVKSCCHSGEFCYLAGIQKCAKSGEVRLTQFVLGCLVLATFRKVLQARLGEDVNGVIWNDCRNGK